MKLMMMMLLKNFEKKKKKKYKKNFDCGIEPLSKNALVVVVRESSWRRQRKRRKFSTKLLEEGAASCVIKWCFLLHNSPNKRRLGFQTLIKTP